MRLTKYELYSERPFMLFKKFALMFAMVRMHVGVNKRRFRWISTATLILIIGFFLCSGYSVYRDVRQTQRDVRYLIGHEHDISSAKGRVALLGALEDLGRSASRAHSSLGLTVASTVIGWIPSVGPDVGNVSALLTDEVVIAREGRTLVQAFGQFSTALQRTQGGSPRSFNDLVDAVEQANQEVKSLPTVQSGFLNPLGAIEQQAQTKVDRLRTLLSDSTNALQVVRVLLGETSAQNILVLPENNAEMREQGSVLSYALLQAHAQHFHLLQSGHSYSLNLSHPVPYVASPGAKAYYLVDGPNSYWQSINISGDFATTGATAAAMFKAATGIRVDAVVALDVPAMAALTGVGGALHVPSVGQPLTAANFSTVVLHDLYSAYPVGPQYQRYDVLGQISSALLHRVESTKSAVVRYAEAIAPLIPARHFLLWARDPAVEQAIANLGADGRLDAVNPTGTFHVAVESDVADKMDYYIHVRERFVVSILSNGAANVRSIVTLQNSAPTGQAPSYQLGPDHHLAKVAGEYVGNVYLWSPRGSHASPGYSDAGLVLSGRTATVLASARTSVQFSTVIPHAIRNGRLDLRLVPQSTLWPAEYSVAVNEGSRTVTVAQGQLNAPTSIVLRVAN